INGLRWRIDPRAVEEVYLESFRGHGDDEILIGQPIVIGDCRIQEGLDSLRSAVPFHWQHEHILSGHRIRLKVRDRENYSERYLMVFTETNRRSGLSGVIPHLGPNEHGRAGEYSCEEFHVWFRENILPILSKGPSRKSN